jgi:hypothetical protein
MASATNNPMPRRPISDYEVEIIGNPRVSETQG